MFPITKLPVGKPDGPLTITNFEPSLVLFAVVTQGTRRTPGGFVGAVGLAITKVLVEGSLGFTVAGFGKTLVLLLLLLGTVFETIETDDTTDELEDVAAELSEILEEVSTVVELDDTKVLTGDDWGSVIDKPEVVIAGETESTLCLGTTTYRLPFIDNSVWAGMEPKEEAVSTVATAGTEVFDVFFDVNWIIDDGGSHVVTPPTIFWDFDVVGSLLSFNRCNLGGAGKLLGPALLLVPNVLIGVKGGGEVRTGGVTLFRTVPAIPPPFLASWQF